VNNFQQIAKVEKKKNATRAIGDGFHSDHTYEFTPALGSILVARVLPKSGGGTVFVDMAKAYESLPQEIKNKINGLRAVHSSFHVFGRSHVDDPVHGNFDDGDFEKKKQQQAHTHPVVINHPKSGKKTLFVNPGFTTHFEGKSMDESKELLELLYSHALQKQHMHIFHWCANSAVMWDNRAVWHCAMNDYTGQYRYMERITINPNLSQGLLPAYPALCKGTEETPANDVHYPFDDVSWPYCIFDAPWYQLVKTSMDEAMDRLEYHGDKWWESKTLTVFAARIAALFGYSPVGKLLQKKEEDRKEDGEVIINSKL
jgi:taurine dioxygenase